MNRFVIITVGKTHSGKSTFARMLEKQLANAVVIDQDHHAEFIHSYYQELLPKKGPNTFKYTITNAIVNYAVNETKRHLILCNSNRNRATRGKLLDDFHQKGFTSILVNFDLPLKILQERVNQSNRSLNILRSAVNFEEVLERQHNETGDATALSKDEADYFYTVQDEAESQSLIPILVNIIHRDGVE